MRVKRELSRNAQVQIVLFHEKEQSRGEAVYVADRRELD